MQSADKVSSAGAENNNQSGRNNPLYAIDSAAAAESNYHQYNTVHDLTGEYTYIESNPLPQGNANDNTYTYAETPVNQHLHSSPSSSAKEGWKNNSIYASSAQQNEEGWTENSVYGK